jgi:hypothetical protein
MYAYIIANSHRSLAVGTANNLVEEVLKMKAGTLNPMNWIVRPECLLFYRKFSTAEEAQRFVMTLEHMSRRTLTEIVRRENPAMMDLSWGWSEFGLDAPVTAAQHGMGPILHRSHYPVY